MYLVDTNIWLERLLEQERSAEVGQFLGQTPTDQLLMTDFTSHSIGVILASRLLIAPREIAALLYSHYL